MTPSSSNSLEGRLNRFRKPQIHAVIAFRKKDFEEEAEGWGLGIIKDYFLIFLRASAGEAALTPAPEHPSNMIRRVVEALGAVSRLEIDLLKKKGDWSAADRKSTYRMKKMGKTRGVCD